MLRMKSLNDTCGRKVYTETGEYFGDIEEAFVQNNKIYGWKIKSTTNSILSKMMSGAKGVIVPQPLIKAIGDIVLISKAAIPSIDEAQEQKE
ncbi:MAG: PRC-barrel domain-containing protein [Nanoarchaeota archaeon]|nr:PRC-barrel domain-containing protein [Nanoarchaeota archaeon]